MSKIFVTSDTHYGHHNICKGTSQWEGGYRDFCNPDEMNGILVENINRLVGRNDTLYHLGDWSFGGIQNIWNFRKQLRCENIHLVYGNHDEHIINNRELPNAWIRYGSGEIVDTEKSTSDYDEQACAQDLFKSTQHVLTFKHNKKTYFCSHYSHQIWNKSHHGVRHLFGHSHAGLEGIGRSMDVGVDSAFKFLGEYRPFSLDEIESILSQIEVHKIDHHGSSTN